MPRSASSSVELSAPQAAASQRRPGVIPEPAQRRARAARSTATLPSRRPSRNAALRCFKARSNSCRTALNRGRSCTRRSSSARRRNAGSPRTRSRSSGVKSTDRNLPRKSFACAVDAPTRIDVLPALICDLEGCTLRRLELRATFFTPVPDEDLQACGPWRRQRREHAGGFEQRRLPRSVVTDDDGCCRCGTELCSVVVPEVLQPEDLDVHR